MAKKHKRGTCATNSTQFPKFHASSGKVNGYNKDSDYLYSMSMAPGVNDGMHWFQMIPAIIFTSIVIMVVRMYQYNRPMTQFFWTNGGNDLVDFFSFYKMVTIIICAVLSLVFLLYRVFAQSFFIKRSAYYLPMIIYSVLVIISYAMSDFKEFSLLGWNDRFEGTLTLLAYMFMLFYVINTVNNEKGIKLIVYPTAIASILLSLLGISQALDHDFFRTTFGKKLITPNWFWDQLDNLTFTFQNKEIYQTVYNINYVSFYLTLLIPLFGMLFIHSVMKGKDETILKKSFWGILFAFNMYNLIGSKSSGGFLGMAVVVLIALLLLNKQIIKWAKPLLILIVVTLIIGGMTYERWIPEITSAAKGVLGINATDSPTETSGRKQSQGRIDYIETKGNDIHLSYEGNEITFTTYPQNPLAVKITDGTGKDLDIKLIDGTTSSFIIDDARFSSFIIGPAQDSVGINYFIIKIDAIEWNFAVMEGHDVLYRNSLGKLVDLQKTQSIGWKNNQNFGNGRGFIWSRTIPLMKDTFLIGKGADTYCIYFPQNDYVGKYNANWNLNLIVDKPHNMYMGAWIGTGGLSVFILLTMFFMYIVQSIKLFWRRTFVSFIEYTGLGIFLGICGFLVSGLVDDSTVSVMPMFYGLLGTGIAINMMLNIKSKL